MVSLKQCRVATMVAMGILMFASAAVTARDNSEQLTGKTTEGWCGTQQHYLENLKAQGTSHKPSMACEVGPCDFPANRDAAIPLPAQEFTYFRLRFHVFRNDDGSSPVSTLAFVQQAFDAINDDYEDSRIKFVYSVRFVNSTLYRSLTEGEISAMKNTYAESPTTQLNIFIVDPTFSYSFGTFPWDGNANTKQGGIVMLCPEHFPPVDNGGTLSHEIGHCLGLWHTHHGVDEVTACGSCYEEPGAAGRDGTGDFCSDTDPTPTNFNCSGPGGNDACSGNPWGPTSFHNYMGYAPDGCYTNFSPQQWGRMHCWTNSNVSGWIANPYVVADTTFGPAPLNVNFTATTAKVVNSWSWDFGDGGNSAIQNPSHNYTTGGLRTVTTTIQTTTGPYQNVNTNLVWIYADTMDVADVQGTTSQKIRVDINVSNKLPLTKMVLPIIWERPLNLPLDSVTTTGLRTAGSLVEVLFIASPPQRREVLQITPVGSPDIAPGTGAVVSLWFKLPFFNLPGVNPVTVETVALWSPLFETTPGTYVPTIYPGSFKMGCCKTTTGNVNNDGGDVCDIADLTTLIDHLFITFAPLGCKEEANCNGDPMNTVDIGDLTALIDHLFITFAALPACQ